MLRFLTKTTRKLSKAGLHQPAIITVSEPKSSIVIVYPAQMPAALICAWYKAFLNRLLIYPPGSWGIFLDWEHRLFSTFYEMIKWLALYPSQMLKCPKPLYPLNFRIFAPPF
jgi:hypothetical protein